MGVPQNEGFMIKLIIKQPTNMDDLGVPLLVETLIHIGKVKI